MQFVSHQMRMKIKWRWFLVTGQTLSNFLQSTLQVMHRHSCHHQYLLLSSSVVILLLSLHPVIVMCCHCVIIRVHQLWCWCIPVNINLLVIIVWMKTYIYFHSDQELSTFEDHPRSCKSSHILTLTGAAWDWTWTWTLSTFIHMLFFYY